MLKQRQIIPWSTRTFKRFLEAEIPLRAAALAYHTMLGIVPIVGLVFWYLNRIHLTDRWLDVLREFITAQLNVNSSVFFIRKFDRLTRNIQGGSWGWVGLIIFLYTAWNLVLRFGQSLDKVLTARVHRRLAFSGTGVLVLRRVLVMILLPIALTFALVLTDWIEKDSWLHTLFKLQMVGPVFALPLAWVGEILTVFCVYYFIPRSPVPWREAMKGALVVAPCNEVLRVIFGVYNHHAVTNYKIYGVLAVVPLFILWIQLSWMVLLGGALFIQLEPDHSVATVRRG